MTNQATNKVSRRHFLQITAVASTVFLGGRWLNEHHAPPQSIRQTRLLMGVPINLTVVSHNKAEAEQAIAATFAEMEHLIALFDWRQADSPLAQLNKSGTLPNPPAELLSLLQEAQQISKLSGGAFDVTVLPLLTAVRQGDDPDGVRPFVNYQQLQLSKQQIQMKPGMKITLDSIAKGRVVDGGTAVLQAHGFQNIVVEAGGDLVAHGSRPDGQSWRIGLTHPRQPDAAMKTVSLTNQAAATSGDYQHSFSQDFSSHHIIDPRRGASPAELASVTVLAPTATQADALSTAVMVLGSQAGLELLQKLPDTAAILITKQMEEIRYVK